MDIKFSVAAHALILISQTSEIINSDQIAMSVGTNPSYIRKVIALLKNAGIVDGHRGISGYTLKIPPDKLTLLQVYQAVTGAKGMHILDIHQNASDKCLVGQHIKPARTDMFKGVEEAFARSLADRTLADCIIGIRKAMQ